MPGDTEGNPTGWTTDTLRVHIQQQITDLRDHFQLEIDNMRVMLNERYATQRATLDAALTAAAMVVQAELNAAEKAVAKAETASEKRFDSVNEFRGQLSDQVATFARREQVDQQLSAISARINDAAMAREAAVDEARQIAARLLPREVYDTQVVAASREREAMTARIAALESRLDVQAGRSQGLGQGWGYLAGGVGLVVAILTIVGLILAFNG